MVLVPQIVYIGECYRYLLIGFYSRVYCFSLSPFFQLLLLEYCPMVLWCNTSVSEKRTFSGYKSILFSKQQGFILMGRTSLYDQSKGGKKSIQFRWLQTIAELLKLPDELESGALMARSWYITSNFWDLELHKCLDNWWMAPISLSTETFKLLSAGSREHTIRWVARRSTELWKKV